MKTVADWPIDHGRVIMAKWLASPNFNQRPNEQQPDLLVIHNISLPPKQFGGNYVEQLFSNQLDPALDPYFEEIYQLQVSSHLYIRRQGELIQFVNCNDRAWHAGVSCFQNRPNCNDFSIGIELEGCDEQPFTEAQYQRLAEVTQQLTEYYPLRFITGHSDIAPERKTDPGPYFDWHYYVSLLPDWQCDPQQSSLLVKQVV